MAWYYKNGEQISGPISPQALRQAANQGIITAATQVRKSEDGVWVAASQVSGLFPPPSPNAAERYHYYDNTTAQKRGPYDKLELENFYQSGIITDNTIIENQAGQTTEWKNLMQKVVTPPQSKPVNDDPFAPAPTPIPLPPDDNNPFISPISPKWNDDDGNNAPFSFAGWIFDFGFKRSYVMKIIRLLVCIVYVTEILSILLGGFCLCSVTFSAAMYGLSHNQASALLMFLLIPLILVGVAVLIVGFRLGCEYSLFFVDWMVSTKKAADKYTKPGDR